jgi:hypothetical protein
VEVEEDAAGLEEVFAVGLLDLEVTSFYYTDFFMLSLTYF